MKSPFDRFADRDIQEGDLDFGIGDVAGTVALGIAVERLGQFFDEATDEVLDWVASEVDQLAKKRFERRGMVVISKERLEVLENLERNITEDHPDLP